MDAYCEVVDAAFGANVRPRCHLEDVTRADFDGWVLPFVDRWMRMSEQVPDELKAKVRICDTLGFGERCGNSPVEGAWIEYIALKGDLCGIRTEVISERADYMCSIGLPIAENDPCGR